MCIYNGQEERNEVKCASVAYSHIICTVISSFYFSALADQDLEEC